MTSHYNVCTLFWLCVCVCVCGGGGSVCVCVCVCVCACVCINLLAELSEANQQRMKLCCGWFVLLLLTELRQLEEDATWRRPVVCEQTASTHQSYLSIVYILIKGLFFITDWSHDTAAYKRLSGRSINWEGNWTNWLVHNVILSLLPSQTVWCYTVYYSRKKTKVL